jgi:hypothetical protein
MVNGHRAHEVQHPSFSRSVRWQIIITGYGGCACSGDDHAIALLLNAGFDSSFALLRLPTSPWLKCTFSPSSYTISRSSGFMMNNWAPSSMNCAHATLPWPELPPVADMTFPSNLGAGILRALRRRRSNFDEGRAVRLEQCLKRLC